jgi:hypothetical protein
MPDCDFVKLGYEAARQIASRTNAGNANEYAARSISGDVYNAVDPRGKIATVKILRLQDRCRLDLAPILLLDEKEQCRALALFAGGAMQFYEENPD